MKNVFKESAKPDFIAASTLVLFSIVILIISFAMPKYVGWGLYATPSLAPIIFGFLLLFCSLVLLIRSIMAKGHLIRITKATIRDALRTKGFQNFTAALGFVFVYYLFTGLVHFWIISAVYLFLNILYFKSVVWWKNLIISVVTAGAIWYCFNYLFLIPLP